MPAEERTAAEALRQLREEDPWFSYPDAVRVLSGLDAAEAPGLVAALAEPSAKIRAAVARALGSYDAPAAREALERALTDPAPEVRRAAIAGLNEFSDAGVAPALGRALAEDPDLYTRLAAVQALAGRPEAAAAVPLARWIESANADDAWVLGEAVAALAAFGSDVALTPLTRLLEHPEPAVREKAVEGLQTLGDPAAAPALLAYANREPDAYLAGMAGSVAHALTLR
jgi:HEAT repeat protein